MPWVTETGRRDDFQGSLQTQTTPPREFRMLVKSFGSELAVAFVCVWRPWLVSGES